VRSPEHTSDESDGGVSLEGFERSSSEESDEDITINKPQYKLFHEKRKCFECERRSFYERIDADVLQKPLSEKILPN
jgi:hypothetical protein